MAPRAARGFAEGVRAESLARNASQRDIFDANEMEGFKRLMADKKAGTIDTEVRRRRRRRRRSLLPQGGLRQTVECKSLDSNRCVQIAGLRCIQTAG